MAVRTLAHGSTLAAAALAASLLAWPPAPARAAAQLEGAVQDSARAAAFLNVVHLTVGIAPDRLLVVAVSIADTQASVGAITWQETPLVPLSSRVAQAGSIGCRVELWTLVDPAPGNNLLRVMLSEATGFGIGAVVYSGVDARMPTSPVAWDQGTRTDLQAVVMTPDGRPVLGAACIGGAWSGGPGAGAASAMSSPGGRTLWDFTEPGVVGVGSHRVSSRGRAVLRWDVNATSTFTWLTAAFSITAAVDEVVPDGGLDPDAAEPIADAGSDTSPADAIPIDAPDDGAPPVDAPDASLEDGPTVTRPVNLDVGCACRTGGTGGGRAVLALPLLAFLALRRRR